MPASPPINQREPRVHSFARILLGLTLIAAPLPFGAVYAWAWASITVLTLAILLLWFAGALHGGKLAIVFSPLYVPAGLFVLLGLIQLLFHLTVSPVATRESLIKLATDFVLFFVVIQLFSGSSADTWRRAGVVVLVFGFVFSFLSILQFLAMPGRVLWLIPYKGNAFGSYIDPDHYAGLMEMVAAVSVGYILSRAKRDPLKSLLWFVAVVPVVSLLLTGSRGGFVALLGEVVILGWILIWHNPSPGRRMRTAATGLVIACVASLFFWLVPPYVLTKLGTVNSYTSETRNGGRVVIWRGSLGILQDHMALGSGLGSFETVYPAYQKDAQDLEIEHAHNDYVEAVTDAGLVGAIIISAAAVLFLLIAFGNLTVRLSQPLGWIPVGAMVGCCGLLIHSFVDFNLHMPANAAWFAFCAGLAILPSPQVALRVQVAGSPNVSHEARPS